MIKLELQRFFELFFVFLVVSTLLLCAAMVLYPSLRVVAVAELVNHFFESVPAWASQTFAMNSTPVPTDLLVYFARMCQPVYLFSCLFSLLTSAGLLSRDEGTGFVDYLLSRPVSRIGFFIRRSLTGSMSLLAGNAAFFFICVVAFELNKAPAYSYLYPLAALLSHSFVIQLVFFCIGLFWSSFGRSAAVSSFFSLATFALTFTLGSVSASGGLPFFIYASPYHYAIPERLLQNGAHFSSIQLIVILALCILCVMAGFLRFINKEFYEKRPKNKINKIPV